MSRISGLLDPEARATLDAVLAKLAAPGMCNPDDEAPCVDGQPCEAAMQSDTRSQPQRNHDGLKAMGRSVLASGELGQHHGLPATIIVSTTLTELDSGAGQAVTAGGTLLPMTDVIRMASHGFHYLVIFDHHTQIPLYLGRSRRLASPGQRIVLHAKDRLCRSGLTRHRHVPEASLVVGHPEEGVLSLSRLLADGGLKLAINGTLEVADVGPEAVGGPPLHELPVGLSTWASAFPALQVRAFERPDRGDLGRVAGVGQCQQEVAVGPSHRMHGGIEDHAAPRRHLLKGPRPREEADVGEGRRGRDAGLGAHQGLRVQVVLGQPTVEGVLGHRSVPHTRQERVNCGRLPRGRVTAHQRIRSHGFSHRPAASKNRNSSSIAC